MKNRWLALMFVVILAGMCSRSSLAQDKGSSRGNLGGLVYDSSKAIVPGADVTITGAIGSVKQTTGEDGSFLFSTLIPGIYAIRVQKAGFKVANIKSAEVQINKTTSVEVILETGQVSETVEVSAASVTVDTSTSAVTADISDTFFENIPVQRGVASLFYLSPGAVDGGQTGSNNPSISGSSGLENSYVADGVSINDPAFGGLGVWARSYGALGSGINLSFVKEVQIKTGGFEPQYGHASGGIVQIVTKSGGTKTYGQIGGYFHPLGMQTTPANADDPKFGTSTKFGRYLGNATYEGDAEIGGYVPLHKLKDHLFYFGTFNPSVNHQYVAPAITSNLFSLYNGELQRSKTSYDYAAKLTFRINDRHTIESSVFGDPSHTNNVPWSTLNAEDKTVNSKWDFGTRNWAVRYDGTLTSSWLVDGAFTWSWNHFSETPLADVTQIVDNTQTAGIAGQRGAFNAQGFGFLEPYDGNTKGFSFDTSKTYHFLGQHTFSIGYTWQYPIYNDITTYSGGKFTLPSANASGGDPGYLNATNPTVAGALANAALSLQLAGTVDPGPTFNTDPALGNPADTTCTLCPYMVVPGYANPVPVLLLQSRGRFDSGITKSTGKYHAAYVNDSWAVGKHVTVNLGLRWEQQRLIGNQAGKLFNDMWSPRFGFILDPKGDRKTKIYANFGRYAFILPLDAAVRALSSEDDILGAHWAPDSKTTGCPTGTPTGAPCVVTDSSGNPDYGNFFKPDAGHLLNQASGGIVNAVNVGLSGGEPFQPGVRMEYTDEFVVGAQHEFRDGIVLSARYIDRRLKRVIEDEGGISVEQFNALANNGGGLNYFIGNPNSKSDIFVNPNEQTFNAVDETQAPCAANSGQPLGAFDCALLTAETSNTPANAAALVLLGFPSACIDTHNAPTPYVAPNVANTFGTVLGSACFPAVNTGTWTDSSGALLPTCATVKDAGCALFGGEFTPDGKPDTYKDPKRVYQAVEIEVNKGFGHNWALVANWRIARLNGNYEGAFRNDNNQADPGISALFDLTEGAFGLLGHQQGIGPLNTDRRHVVNIYSTFVLDKSRLKGLVLGGGLRIQSGVPLTTLVAQQAYQNQGEVPLNGRGDLGRAPTTAGIDAHLEYPWKFNERVSLRFGFDAFNIANRKSQTLLNQNNDQGFGIPNPDFKLPYATIGMNSYFFQAPFSSRASVRLVF
jgi:carboxypeptidase family protein